MLAEISRSLEPHPADHRANNPASACLIRCRLREAGRSRMRCPDAWTPGCRAGRAGEPGSSAGRPTGANTRRALRRPRCSAVTGIAEGLVVGADRPRGLVRRRLLLPADAGDDVVDAEQHGGCLPRPRAHGSQASRCGHFSSLQWLGCGVSTQEQCPSLVTGRLRVQIMMSHAPWKHDRARTICFVNIVYCWHSKL